jgi:hypothetical protein
MEVNRSVRNKQRRRDSDLAQATDLPPGSATAMVEEFIV